MQSDRDGMDRWRGMRAMEDEGQTMARWSIWMENGIVMEVRGGKEKDEA